VLKLKKIASFSPNITPAVKCLFFGLFLVLVSSFHLNKHPFYLGVVDIKQDAKQHTLNVSVKLFINDIEDALKKTSTKNIDLLNPKNKQEMETELFAYIKKRLSISVNNKATPLDFIGYEREEEAIWTYIEIKKVNQPKTITVDAKLLYDFLPQQSNIVHAEINGIKKSSKVTNPDSKVELSF
jgi:hypothetical protein